MPEYLQVFLPCPDSTECKTTKLQGIVRIDDYKYVHQPYTKFNSQLRVLSDGMPSYPRKDIFACILDNNCCIMLLSDKHRQELLLLDKNGRIMLLSDKHRQGLHHDELVNFGRNGAVSQDGEINPLRLRPKRKGSSPQSGPGLAVRSR